MGEYCEKAKDHWYDSDEEEHDPEEDIQTLFQNEIGFRQQDFEINTEAEIDHLRETKQEEQKC